MTSLDVLFIVWEPVRHNVLWNAPCVVGHSPKYLVTHLELRTAAVFRLAFTYTPTAVVLYCGGGECSLRYGAQI